MYDDNNDIFNGTYTLKHKIVGSVNIRLLYELILPRCISRRFMKTSNRECVTHVIISLVYTVDSDYPD